MIVAATSERPMIFSVAFRSGSVIYARETPTHQTVLIEFPILVAIRTEPVSAVAAPLICKTDSNSIAVERPKLLDQSIV